MSFIKNLRKPDAASVIRQLILSWLFAVTVEYIALPVDLRTLATLDGLAAMSLARVVIVTASCTVTLFALARFFDTAIIERAAILAVFVTLSYFSLRASFSWAFLIACIIVCAILVVFLLRGHKSEEDVITPSDAGSPAYAWITAALALAFFIFASAWTVSRVYSFCTPTYDFGIFAQMFHNMKESGLPITTVERDGALSHFAVHVSPIYYLLLPFYCIFPRPETLQVLQAAVIASAVIPLWKICRRHGLSDVERCLVCALLLLYPAFMGGVSYDIHENCFLTPLILWLFYGITKKSYAITAVSAVLVLLVKEDAAVYVAVIALWLIVKSLTVKCENKRFDIIMGGALLAASIAYFTSITSYLATSGDGVMTYRYGNFMYDGSDSLVTVIKAVLISPMKALFECVDAEKLKFIGLTLIPLCGLPLITRRYDRLTLVIPYLLLNLMSDYQYQHDIFFQYCFGSIAFLIYLTAVNLADLKLSRERLIALISAVAISAGCFGAVVYPKAIKYPQYVRDNREFYESVCDTLDTIPDGTSVAATTFHTTYLSNREVLYDIKYASTEHILECEYVVIKISEKTSYQKFATGGRDNGYHNFIKLLTENGYEKVGELKGIIDIYKKAE